MSSCKASLKFKSVNLKASKLLAFTLAEVLITLGIIGVVAAMTIPNMITNIQAIKLQSQYKEAYSTIAQVVKMYNSDDERDSYQGQSYYKNFFKYFTGLTDCGEMAAVADDSEYCFIRQSNVDGNAGTVTNKDENYKNYSKLAALKTQMFDNGQFYIQKNGMLFGFDLDHANPFISVDINGKKNKPNVYGYDVFTFELVSSEKEGGLELLPMGAYGTHFYSSRNGYCSKTSSDGFNGATCAYFAQTDSAYFKKLPK